MTHFTVSTRTFLFHMARIIVVFWAKSQKDIAPLQNMLKRNEMLSECKMVFGGMLYIQTLTKITTSIHSNSLTCAPYLRVNRWRPNIKHRILRGFLSKIFHSKIVTIITLDANYWCASKLFFWKYCKGQWIEKQEAVIWDTMTLMRHNNTDRSSRYTLAAGSVCIATLT